MNSYVQNLIDKRIEQLKKDEINIENHISDLETEKGEQEKILKGIQTEMEELKK